jgi:23S rRNA pseudouridine1911/1915/1917 synthase
MRLDQALASRFPELSRRKARELIAAGRVLVNQRPVRIASRAINERDEIAVFAGAAERPPLIAITDDWLAVNKPAGMPTQPPRDRSVRSLEELLRVEYREIYLVHRLDTPTSGVVLFARTRDAAAKFSNLFAGGAMKKVYVAIIDGVIDHEITIDSPIDGRAAITIARPIGAPASAGCGLVPAEAGAPSSRVEVEIKTGRTHQIRIHLASIGHPVAGDRRYGGSKAERLMLHAWKLQHPTIGTLEAPLPPAMT